MTNDQLLIMLLSALAMGALLYVNIKKITDKIDFQNENPDLSYYNDFCEDIIDKLDELKMHEPAKNVSKENITDFLVGLEREIRYTQSMNANTKDKSVWEDRLFNILSKLDNFTNENFNDGEKIADNLREELQEKFAKIQKRVY